MKRFHLIIILIFILPSFVIAKTPVTEQESQIIILLGKYGDNYEQKLQKITAIEKKLQSLHGIKVQKIRESLAVVKQYIILDNLADYTTKKYIKSSLYKKEKFRAGYEKLKKTDSRVDIHPYYLKSLIYSIREKSILKEDSSEFLALVYILFSLSERMQEDKDYEKKIKSAWEKSLSEIQSNSVPKIPLSKIPVYARILDSIAEKEKINIYSATDLVYMKERIKKQKLSQSSLYFKAYLSLREKLLKYNGKLSIKVQFTHLPQSRKLSCEANSATDLINFYRTASGQTTVNEADILSILPIAPDAIARKNRTFFWGDPHKAFVGNINGKQSSNPNLFTGYGIYADGILPSINQLLSSENLSAKKGLFEEKRILDSLSMNHPIMFWYLSAISENGEGVKKYITKPIIWKTPEGKEIHGYIGEHTGLIVGADFDEYGHIQTVSYYQGRSETLEKRSFTELKELASFFNEAIYISRR